MKNLYRSSFCGVFELYGRFCELLIKNTLIAMLLLANMP